MLQPIREYYNDFWRLNHDLFFTCGALIEVDGGFPNVGFPRCRDRGAYDCSDIALLDVMSPHIGAALRLHQRLNRANQAAANAEAALDRMHDAMLVVDSGGRIVYANPAADAELVAGTHLSSRNGRLMAGPLVAQDELERAFHAAAGISQLVATQIPAALASAELDPALRASIAFYPLPARSHDPMALRRAGVLVVLCRKHGGRTLSAALLRRLYGLTPTEARIAQMLSLGQSLEEIAGTLQIRAGTSRSHLKQVFQKTGTRRQGQLASLLNSMQPRIVD
jgi:DNA-binding CsgD family transcriptional regulator